MGMAGGQNVLFAQKPVDIRQYQIKVRFIQLFHGAKDGFGQLWIGISGIKKLDWRNAKVVTDGKEFRHGRKGFSGGNVVDIPPAVPQIIAHFIL